MFVKRLALILGLFVVACGGADEGEPTKATSYETMSFEERDAFMRTVVLPQMTETFAAFDSKYATSMTCETCHGEGAKDGSYTMPSAGIPPLPGTEEAFLEYNKDPEHARWSQFMMDKVWPQMANLLQVEMYNPTTQEAGFSCSNCHTIEGVTP